MHPFLTPEKRDGFSVRRASPPTKCNTTLSPARPGAVVGHDTSRPLRYTHPRPPSFRTEQAEAFPSGSLPRGGRLAQKGISLHLGVPFAVFARRVRTQLFAFGVALWFPG